MMIGWRKEKQGALSLAVLPGRVIFSSYQGELWVSELIIQIPLVGIIKINYY